MSETISVFNEKSQSLPHNVYEAIFKDFATTATWLSGDEYILVKHPHQAGVTVFRIISTHEEVPKWTEVICEKL